MIPKSVTVAAMQQLDKMAIENIGIPSVVLMENAGRAVAEEVQRRLKGRRHPRVCVVCGLGNNAGDGLVAARHLMAARIRTEIFFVGKGRQLKRDAGVNYRILKRLSHPMRELVAGQVGLSVDGRQAEAGFSQVIAGSDIVVDAIFGVGLNRQIGEPFRSVIEIINREARRVVSVDIPSGLDGTTGGLYGVCIKADVTVTFSLAKRGFFRRKGPAHTGRIVVAPIGIPWEVLRAGIAA